MLIAIGRKKKGRDDRECPVTIYKIVDSNRRESIYRYCQESADINRIARTDSSRTILFLTPAVLRKQDQERRTGERRRVSSADMWLKSVFL